MTVSVSLLPNGLRCVTHHMPHLETTSLGVWVGTGSRHEAAHEHGACHFLEHMAFKGTASRSARAIAEEIEAVGGELNAATGLDATAYFARVLSGDEGVALSLIADILQNSLFGPEEMEREREVILQEIAALEDSPDDIVYDLLQDAAYPGQAVGRPVIGTPRSVRSLSASQLKALLSVHYRPENMVISAAGAARHETVVRHVEALFGGLTGGRVVGVERAVYRGGLRSSQRRFEQSHIMLGFEGPSYRDEAYFVAQVFSGLFGGGMSSRLFQEVREKRGLCYSIYSSAWGLEETGMLTVHAATGAGTMTELMGVVAGELAEMAENGPRAAELQRAKAQLRAGLMMSLESSGARAEQMARHMLAHGRVIPPGELVDRVEAVSGSDVRTFAGRIAAGRPSIAVVGAGKASSALAERSACLFGA